MSIRYAVTVAANGWAGNGWMEDTIPASTQLTDVSSAPDNGMQSSLPNANAAKGYPPRTSRITKTRPQEEFYHETPSHNTGHGTGAHWH